MRSHAKTNAALFLFCLLCGCGGPTSEKQLKEVAAKYESLIEITATNCTMKGMIMGIEWERSRRAGAFTNRGQDVAAFDYAVTNWLANRKGRLTP